MPPTPKLVVWMFYRTDGDSGYYGIKLFQTEAAARAYLAANHDGYSNIEEVEVR